MKSNFLLFLTLFVFTTVFCGCNAMRGAGKDVQNAGGSIQRTVDHNS
ncbi:MAG: entericidin A/B family lipoprotein [Candidatus Omnitrophica bacterium]|nr:entericidin A/B family lipoprotein [Candidatus Omnitrophota bacterium]